MAGVKAFPRDADMLQDVRILKRRGLSTDQIAKQLGMSRATLYRILRELS